MGKTNGCFVVSWDFNNGEDKDLVIVGERVNGELKIINAFQGQEARDIYEKLRTPNCYIFKFKGGL